jgi:hypothetical protein
MPETCRGILIQQTKNKQCIQLVIIHTIPNIHTGRICNYFVLFVNGIGPVAFSNSETKLTIPTLLMPELTITFNVVPTSSELITIFIKKIPGKITLDSMQTHSVILPTEYKIRVIFCLEIPVIPYCKNGTCYETSRSVSDLGFFGRH